ncbi:MAG: LuxR C-terminal-related transcriptional regulator [Chloroflexota bacterium]
MMLEKTVNIHLTGREQEVLELMATGATNRQIAQALFISKETVKTHVAHILRKFDASSRTEVVGRSFAMGLVKPGTGQ